MRHKIMGLGILALAFLVILISQKGALADEIIGFSALPEDILTFQELQASNNTPEGAAALFITAMIAYENSPQTARAFMTLSLSKEQVVSGPNGYGGKQPDTTMSDHIDRLGQDPNIARSYVTGATPQNGYALPPGDLTYYLTRNRLSVVLPTEIRVFAATSGAGTPRPIYMKQEADGIWRVAECSSLFVGIYRPAH